MTRQQLMFTCPKCQTKMRFNTSTYWQQREEELRQREQALRVRESEHEKDVRLIKSCLHPDRHPEQAERFTKAMQAFNRLLESSAESAADDIPF